jgi:CubicO group peptidase (beta-lactamase class C family)
MRSVPGLLAGLGVLVLLAFLSSLLAIARFRRLDAASPAAALRRAPPTSLRVAGPGTVGMSKDRLDVIGSLVQRGINAGGFPGAAVVVGRGGDEVLARGFGRLDWRDDSPPVDPDSSLYDLASLTKVIATTSAIMLLVDDGVLHVNDPVSRWLPDFKGGHKGDVTIAHLLTHRSGLPAGRPLYKIKGGVSRVRAAVLSTPLACRPGACYIYSDLGADVLAFIVEAATGEHLDTFVARRIFAPLGMTQTTFHPRGDQLRRLAPTEGKRGQVHDKNAVALGGVAGHAGLFSTANDLAVFAQTMLNYGAYNGVRIFDSVTVARFTRRIAGTRTLGWDTCDSVHVESTCGHYMSDAAYGHLGFTGTSIWIDPIRQVFIVVLTNRVHDPRRSTRSAVVIHDVRADIADAAMLAVLDAIPGSPAIMPEYRTEVRANWKEPVSHRTTRSTAHRRTHRRGRR